MADYHNTQHNSVNSHGGMIMMSVNDDADEFEDANDDGAFSISSTQQRFLQSDS